ncbi:MAG: RagB/SusD family nutrient uptake outer membrane protein [Mucilaginibacter sp.]
MKRNSLIMMVLAGVVTFSFTSCKKNLILTPNYEVTSQAVYSTPTGIKQALAKVYSSFVLTGNSGPAGSGDVAGIDEGTSEFFRLFWYAQELPTDEAVIAWGDPGVPDFHQMSWSSSNTILTGLYYRSMYQITLANEFLVQTTDANMSKEGITGQDLTNVHYYRAEARFIRAYQYWVLMDLFAKPPFITETTPIGSVVPPQTTRPALFSYIESELKAIDGQLVAPMKNEYGRVDNGADWALLARLYLNAQVYTGTARWTDAMTYANKVIGAGYTLNSNYDNLMLADNNTNGAQKENIFAIPYDGNNTQGYGGTTFMTHASVGGTMPSQNFGIAGGWDGIRTTSALVSKFPSPKTQNTTNFPNNGNVDTRAEFWYDGQNETINSITTFTDGLAVTKWRNVTSSGAQGSNPSFSDIDEPLFRLPEMYLIYAEADVRANNIASTTSLDYINKIIDRAYGTAAKAVAAGAELTLPTQLTKEFILDERARELYWEGFRRTDLIRYGLFTSGSYVWPWKGGVKAGTSVPDYRNIYPIPQQDRSVNPNLAQNPGY